MTKLRIQSPHFRWSFPGTLNSAIYGMQSLEKQHEVKNHLENFFLVVTKEMKEEPKVGQWVPLLVGSVILNNLGS